MKKLVPKRTIRRLNTSSENQELRNMIIMLELCKEADDDLWKQLIEVHLDELKILNSEDGKRIRKGFRRSLEHEL